MFRYLPVCFAAVILIASCSGGNEGRLSRKEKAYRDYQNVSSRFEAYLPVADDTAIFSAVDYFRRRGPEEYYGKSLMMQGAVLFEQGRFEEALETYKLAEEVFEESGSYTDLGLVNARIGEVYRLSYVNDSASVSRLGKAVHYFELSGDRKRVAASSLDYARSIMADSLDVADVIIHSSLEISKGIRDTSLMLYVYELLTYVESQRNDHLKFIELADGMLSEIGRLGLNPLNEGIYNNLYFKLADTYAELGMADKAAESLSNVMISSGADSLLYYYAKEEIAKLENNWPEAYRALERSGRLYNDIVAANYNERLVEAELRYDLSRAEENYYKNQNKNLVIIIFLLLSVSLSVSVTLVVRNNLRDKKRKIQEYSERLMLAEKELKDSAWKLSILDSRMEHQRKGNMELQKLSGELMRVINEIGYAYEVNKDNSNPVRIIEGLRKQIEATLSMQEFEDQARMILEIMYPGMLEKIFAEADPALTEEEKWIIMLMCCQFETNTICLFCDNSVTQLNNKKSRLTKKLHTQERLSKYLKKRMEDYTNSINLS